MKASRLEGLELRTDDGRRLGHVLDLRLKPAASAEGWPDEVEGLVYGRLGVLERLGLRAARTHTLPWRDVIGVRHGVLVVRRTTGVPSRS